VKNIYVPLPEQAEQALAKLAETELRSPKKQATVLIIEGLTRRGVLRLPAESRR
jgi:hypothetical protein